jgi:hypothetical protein
MQMVIAYGYPGQITHRISARSGSCCRFENENLIKFGLPTDIWFHVDKLSSAHVYLRLNPGQSWEDIPEALLIDCCQLVKVTPPHSLPFSVCYPCRTTYDRVCLSANVATSLTLWQFPHIAGQLDRRLQEDQRWDCVHAVGQPQEDRGTFTSLSPRLVLDWKSLTAS